MARFAPLSLIIDVDPGEELVVFGEGGELPTLPAGYARQRWQYHETLHLWQQASAGFLVRSAEEDWSRMRRYEERGDRPGQGAIAAEYGRVDPDASFSARDLQECLTRYWELQAFDPLAVLAEDLGSGRIADETLRQRLQRFCNSPGHHADTPLTLAMESAAGSYARPFLSLSGRAGPALAVGLFPLAAFFALQTDSPVRFYMRLVDSAMQHVEPPPITANAATLGPAWYSTIRERAAELHEEMFGTGLGFGMDVLRRSRLLEHPGYTYLLERMDGFVAQATRVYDFQRDALERHPGLFTELEQKSRALQARYDETAQGAIAAMARLEGHPYEPQPTAGRPEPTVLGQGPAGPARPELLTPRRLAEFVAACPQGTKSALGVPGVGVTLAPGDPTTVLSDHLVPPCIRAGQRIVPNISLLWQSNAGTTELANQCLEVERRWLRFRAACRGFS